MYIRDLELELGCAMRYAKECPNEDIYLVTDGYDDFYDYFNEKDLRYFAEDELGVSTKNKTLYNVIKNLRKHYNVSKLDI